ncbi:PP2C family protein-serine/threonine phosphatase [Trinickia fusca]|nr:protein phosphatase 2C domain-containing protein [Trinickia fusca]
MNVSHAHFTGAGSRTSNQDCIGFQLSEDRACFVVSDGIGGAPGGEVAARCAVDSVLACWSGSERPVAELARACVKAANAAIVARQEHDLAHRHMSATVVALFLDRRNATAQWAHVGDSRLYRFRRGALLDRTRDHSVTQRMSDAGFPGNGISPNLLHMALGMRGPISPGHSGVHSLQDGDVFLLCTDGFWQLVPEKTIEHRLRIVQSVDDWICLLEHEASRSCEHSGHGDNYSALAVWIGRPENVTLMNVRP